MTDGQPADRIAELIRSTPYTPTTAEGPPSAVNAQGIAAMPGAAAVSPAAPTEAPVQPERAAPDTPTPPPLPQIPPEVIERLRNAEAKAAQLEEVNQRMQFDRLQNEEYKFLDSIAHLPIETQEHLALQRYVEQMKQVNQWQTQEIGRLNQQQQDALKRQTDALESGAKRWVAFIKASQSGLDFDNPVVQRILLASENKDDMDRNIAGLRQLGAATQQAPAFVNGGQRATATAPTGPERGSGDILGLIRSTPYTLARR